MRVDIRAAEVNDAGLLAKLGQETFVEAFQGRIRDADLMAFAAGRFGLEQQTAEIAQPDAALFIARCDGDALGYAKLCESVPPACVTPPHTVELERLYLYSRWYGRGVADALTEACLAEAQRRTYDAIWLDVWDENLRAQAFYRKHLFNLVGERGYLVGMEEQRHLLMCRELTARKGVGP